MSGDRASRKNKRTGGFSSVELNIVVLVIAVLIFALLPSMLSLVSNARLSNVRQDAAGIGAAIEVLKLEGRFDPDDSGLATLIFETSGIEYGGRISELKPDGCFYYSRTDGGVTYVVRYNSLTGSVENVE